MNTTGNDSRLADLSPDEKRAELARLLGEKSAGAGDVFPLSLPQERLWFLDRWEPGSPAYNSRAAVRLDGRLDAAALERALNEIVRRHESLRTTFSTVGGRAVQVIAPGAVVPLPVIDISELPAGPEREEQALLLSTAEVRRPFDLARGPVIRTLLLRLAPEQHLLVFVSHHIVCDEWSMGVLVREFAALYEAFAAGKPSPLPELPIQYADFAVWQREWLQGDVLEKQLDYWKKQLSGTLPQLAMPTDRVRPAVYGFAGTKRSRVMPARLGEELRALSRREGVTPFLTCLTAFYALLYRYTQQEDVLVGCPVTMRNRPELEGLIGFFVNTLVMRGDLSGNPSFRQLLGRLREVARGAYAHQDVPFEKLVEALHPDRDPSRSPLFQVMFVMLNDVAPPTQVGGMRMTPLEQLDTGAVKFDLILTTADTPQGLVATFRYSTDLFDASTIERMLGHFQTLLEAIAADPDRPIANLQFLRPAEVQELLLEHNDTTADYPKGWCAHQLFEAQVERTPDAVALSFCGEQLSYGELNRRANQVARYLQVLGVGPEVRVGLCMERSLEMVVGLLGILKAGGAYVPLDPAYPPERLALMLEDSGVGVLLTQERVLDRLPEHRAQVLTIDVDWAAISQMPPDNAVSGVTAENLAYVIYTSGSTGRPKGVMVEHRGICNLAQAQARFFPVRADSRVLQFASISFDASVSEVFTALCTGATLVLAPQSTLMPGPTLVQLLRDERVSVVTLPPSVLGVLPAEEFSALRTLVVAGEACPADLVERWGGGRRFINAYGPTEVTVCATMGECHGGARPPGIGRPMANTQAFILDAQMQLVPIGVPGELYVGSVGLARGYHDRPDLTAERFVPHPFSTEPGARLYRTGDRARWLPDGTVEYLGRVDNQVKVRGFRVEPGEVEVVLHEHPNVREAVVTAREDVPGVKRLVGYVSARQKPEPSAAELRSFLLKRLPEYMVPSAFVVLEAMPLGPTGKVDRGALPAPDGARTRDRVREYVAPRTPLEEWLQARWKEVLGVEQIGVHENFFELGGDSILAAMLVFKLQEAFGEPVYVVSLFKGPTVAELGVYLQEHYPDAVARVSGMQAGPAKAERVEKVDPARVALIREIIPPLPAHAEVSPPGKNPPAVFVLSPPRSGSTLLRVMLAGHTRLFAPPELELLGFNTLLDRRDAFAGQYSFWLEGTIRALMEIKRADADEAKRIMEDCERRNLSVKGFYRLMQEWIGDRRLVDKTPSYALDLATLRRAEEDFAEPVYIHLLRHPYGMIQSFEEAKLDQVFFRYPHLFSTRELAELIWVVSQQNILKFLEGIPARRQCRLAFEDLVGQPKAALEGVCRFLGLDFDPEMVQPYRNKKSKMTDGIHPLSKMLGDVKFHKHEAIDARIANRWARQQTEDFLGDVTRELAASLGYRETLGTAGAGDGKPGAAAAAPAEPAAQMPVAAAPPDVPVAALPGSPLVPMQPSGNHRPLFCVHPPGGIVFPYADLAARMRPDHPMYAFQGRGLENDGEPHGSLEEMAAYYIDAMRSIQPEGPYHIAGWSLGGTVAFEMAQQLHARGERVGLIGLFDTGMSNTAERDEPTDLERAKFIVGMARVHGLELPLEQVLRLRPHEQLRFVSEQVAKTNLIPAHVLPYPIERVLELHQAHITAAVRYKRRYYPGKVTLFRCSVDLDPLRGPKTEDYGWGKYAAEVEVVRCPGSHRTLLRDPHAKVTAERVKAALDRIEREALAGAPGRAGVAG
jgi:amino acid adenylation domain-containing protein